MSNVRWGSRVVGIEKPSHSTEYASLTVPGGRITVALGDRPALGLYALRLDFEPDNEDQVESSAPEPEQEQPLQRSDREAPAADPGIGAPGPLPDAGPQEGEVVEGVGGEAQGQQWKLAFDVAAMISTARSALDDLQVAACHAIDQGGITSGRLVAEESGVSAVIEWPLRPTAPARLLLEGWVTRDEVED